MMDPHHGYRRSQRPQRQDREVGLGVLRLIVAGPAVVLVWLLRTPRPGPVAELAGTRTVVQTTRYLSGRRTWETSGISAQREAPVADPDIIRRLDAGQAAYLHRGGVTYPT